ncbi:uncharacterized protein LOC131610583 isoform X3 [Vicia villosa]|uniref:uncharacterized protein LOC131610583 isoform X3 n=1 Tax=Vicia villosa TaxID=3911 RepID=UPI00273B654C|nr:uncharacterized protein LOC131610583 isoform X3 [Vicia villosa]
MRHSSVFGFALFLSFSVTSSSSFSSNPNPLPLPSSSISIPKATPSDLLSLLGPKPLSKPVNPVIARKLNSCLKFLVPFSPTVTDSPRHRKLFRTELVVPNRRHENDMIWWPPESVLELARLAVDSSGDPAAIHRLLDPTVIPVPSIEGSSKNRCQLTRTPYGRRFISEELNMYMQFLFDLIVDRGPSVGFDVALSRFDLFHGHLFLTRDSGRLGILFHAREFPAYNKQVFPYNMGYCQIGTSRSCFGNSVVLCSLDLFRLLCNFWRHLVWEMESQHGFSSNVTYDDSMNLRNILWLAPLPDRSSKSWVAPASKINFS